MAWFRSVPAMSSPPAARATGGGRALPPSVGPNGAVAPRPTDIDWVSASEIGSWCYCGKMYWLAKVQHERPNQEGQARLKAGVVHHHAHGVTYDWQLKVRSWAMSALATTMVLAFLTWLYLHAQGGA
jgi:hypothetical protein